jgi:hypothetical protein
VPAGDLSYHFSLDSNAPAMNDAHQGESLLQGLVEVFLHDIRHVARAEGVQVDPIFDWDFDLMLRQILLLYFSG